MTDVIVIGAGLFGATIARGLAISGMDVRVIDDCRPLSGSVPSGSLMKPGWFSSMGKEVYEPALETLEDIYGIQDRQFTVWPTRMNVTVHWIPTRKILHKGDLNFEQSRVLSVGAGMVTVRTSVDDTVHYEAKTIIVAAGIWCDQLMAVPNLQGKQGVSFRVPGQVGNFIRPWAPYKQAVAFQEEVSNFPDDGKPNTVWAGDGSAILPKNWNSTRMEKSMSRMADQTKLDIKLSHAVEGIRPYVKGAKPCLLEERSPGVWLATGGAKNGLVAAGWVTSELLKELS